MMFTGPHPFTNIIKRKNKTFRIGAELAKDIIKTEKIYTKYRLESPDGEYSIIAKVSEGLITLETKRSDKEFIFLKSKKEDVKALAELFLKACEL